MDSTLTCLVINTADGVLAVLIMCNSSVSTNTGLRYLDRHHQLAAPRHSDGRENGQTAAWCPLCTPHALRENKPWMATPTASAGQLLWTKRTSVKSQCGRTHWSRELLIAWSRQLRIQRKWAIEKYGWCLLSTHLNPLSLLRIKWKTGKIQGKNNNWGQTGDFWRLSRIIS